MRKLLFVTITACLLSLLLTSCSGPRSINPDRLKLDKAYEFVADISYGEDSSVTGQFNRINTNEWEIALKEPYALEGVTLSYNNGEVTAEYMELNGIVTSDNAIYTSMLAAFENAVNGDGREAVSIGEEIIITSKAGTPSKSYEIVFDKKTLTPLTLKIPDISLTAELSPVQAIQRVQVLHD